MDPTAHDELALARDLVLAAGDLLLDHLGDAGAVEAKGGVEFVTAMDRRSEELLLGGLSRHFPADAVLAEESGDHAGPSGRRWYVDPLDGTTNYAHGYPFFAVSVACADGEGLQFGAVYAPYLDELYLAVRGGGARWERPRTGGGGPLAVRPEVPLERALLATGFPYVRDEVVDRNTDLVRRFLKAPCQGLRRAGSAALDLAHVAVGRLDGYWEMRLQPWDSAAGTLLVREAGGTVSDFGGAGPEIPHHNVVAAGPGLHRTMLGVLAAGGGDPA